MNNLIIDKRLLTASGFVTHGGVAVDVGTDHAYLAVYLVKEGISERCIACDVAQGPLAAAKKTVEENMLSDKIDVVLSDGLDSVISEGITDVIMCGMGGELIADIIARAEFLKGDINIIAQPMTRADFFRKWLYENGFEIVAEKACSVDRFVYSVMNIRFCGEKQSVDDYFATVGKLDLSDSMSKAYVKEKAQRMITAANGMIKSLDKKAQGADLLSLANKLLKDIGE